LDLRVVSVGHFGSHQIKVGWMLTMGMNETAPLSHINSDISISGFIGITCSLKVYKNNTAHRKGGRMIKQYYFFIPNVILMPLLSVLYKDASQHPKLTCFPFNTFQ
jgi:hypothetical protein